LSGIIKICGLKSLDMLDVALENSADMVGFVHFAKSPRHLTLEQGAPLLDHARGKALRVALMVDPDAATLETVITAWKPDILQLHGEESTARIEHIRADYGLPIMKAMGVATEQDLNTAQIYEAKADYLLLDAKPPPNALHPGGNGLTFDWSLLHHFTPSKPCLLSGGLNADNVEIAIRITKLTGIDVSSGVESAPGVKDAAKIIAFIKAARKAFAALS
jgi:phosphoribosylanthranilate isomerase